MKIPTETKLKLFEYPGVTSVGEMNGNLIVGVEEDKFLQGIPLEYEGIPIKTEVIGKIVPLNATEA